ncbi:MAG TPA: hypothetical protein PKJ64_09480, partial [bacterium]|nr:hypothetical protein [bacterium]
MRTTDGGTNWTKVHTAGNNRIQQVLADPSDFNIQYATAEALGFLKSTDAGITWAPSSTGIGAVDRLEMAIAPSNTNLLYASVESGTNSVLYRSTNGGANWATVADTTGQSASSIAWLGAQGWYDNTIAVHPYDPNILFVGGINIYRINISNSISAGRRGTTRMTNWYPGLSRPSGGTYPYIHADQHNIVMIPISEPNNFWILHTNDGGFARSTDGGQTWLFDEDEAKGIVTAQFYGVDKMPGASAYIGGTQDNGTWMSPVDATVDSSWYAMLGGDGYDGVWKANDPNQIIGCLYDNRLYKTTDGGQTWNSATSGLLDVDNANSAFVTEIGRSKLDPDLLIVPGGSGFWRSEDFGDSWTLAPITSSYGFSTARNLAEISLADPNIVWAGTNMSAAGKLHVSTNAGKSYTATNNYTAVTLGRVTGIATHPYNPNEAFALFSIADKPKVLRTMDRGQTWTDISGFGANSSSNNGFPDVATYSLLVMPTDTNEIWAGTEIGIFRSTDNGATWAYANNGLPAVSVWELKIIDNEIVAATHGRGIWTAPISAPPLPTVVLGPTLKQAYQNPATGLVNVELGLRNTYDSTIVFMGNTRALTLGSTGINDSTVSFSSTQIGSVSIKASSYRNGTLYETVAKSVTLVQAVARNDYYNAFNTSTSANGEFTGSLFSATKPSGFSSFALHTAHPYTNNTNNTFQLNYPITVASDSSMIVFDEIAIVEPGDPGVPFPEPEFWDYVVVEATSDGISWEPVIDGWDSRANSTWLSTFNSVGSGSNSMFKQRRIDLTDKYEPGTKIFIRFRMFTDAASTGWGWCIDNLKINAIETPPTVTVGALASPVINVAKFAVSSNRGMSTAALTAGGQSVALSRLGGSLFFGSYSITSGTVSITATCSDSVGNTSTTLNKQFTVTPLSKSSSLGGYSVTGSGEGYVVASLVQATDIPSGWIEIGSMYEAGITGTPTNLKITYDLPNESTLDRMIPGSSQRYKIGLYEKDGNQWKLISAESNGKLSGEFSHKAIAAFYNPDFEGIPTEFAL